MHDLKTVMLLQQNQNQTFSVISNAPECFIRTNFHPELSWMKVFKTSYYLCSLSERSYRVSQRNFESIVDDSNSRLQRISRILKASRRNRRLRRFWEQPWSSKAVSSSVHVKFLSAFLLLPVDVFSDFFGIVDFKTEI